MAGLTYSEYKKALDKTKSDEQNLANDREKKADAKKQTEQIQLLKDNISYINNQVIEPAVAEMKKAEKDGAPYFKAATDYKSAHPDAVPSTDPTYANLLAAAQPFKDTIDRQQGRIDEAVKRRDRLKQQLKEAKNKGKKEENKKTKNNKPRGEKIKFSKDYKYNAPMVSTAYFGASGFENSVLNGNLVDAGNYGDARKAWDGTTGGRGTIQMDKKFLSAFTSGTQSPDKVKIDTQKYGFKFLYNPQTVNMAWGLLNYMSPPYEAMAQDPFQVVSAGLMPSVVSFELLLNRIHDFDYIGPSGLVAKGRTSSTQNPYPQNVSTEDLVDIYNKGTMYDLEYLLKTLNGPDGTFESMLNGNTADRGWLRPTIVELHLGNKLRYRVRISEFAVNHIMFNPRMVPILSSVKLTCNRFADGPDTDYYGTNGGGLKSPVSGLKELQNTVPGYGR